MRKTRNDDDEEDEEEDEQNGQSFLNEDAKIDDDYDDDDDEEHLKETLKCTTCRQKSQLKDDSCCKAFIEGQRTKSFYRWSRIGIFVERKENEQTNHQT